MSPSIVHCELTHLERARIDYPTAVLQQEAYEAALRELGYTIARLPADDSFPDGVFVEDTAVVTADFAVATRPGIESRRGEVASVVDALARYRPVHVLEAPGTMDGGDVLRIGREFVIGIGSRTNAEGAAQFAAIVDEYGYRTRTIRVDRCLHLKTAVSPVGPRTLLLNPAWVDERAFPGFELIPVAADEPFAANALLVGDLVIHSSAHPRTAEKLAAAGIRRYPVDTSEIAKAEGGVTCCSLLLE